MRQIDNSSFGLYFVVTCTDKYPLKAYIHVDAAYLMLASDTHWQEEKSSRASSDCLVNIF